MKICFLGNSMSCMSEKRMRSPNAGSICWHSSRFHSSLLYHKHYDGGHKALWRRRKTFLLCKANFLRNTDRRESSLIRARTYLTEASSLRVESGKKMESQSTGNDGERLFAEWRLRHDNIFNYMLPRCSKNSFLCLPNWCFGRDVYRRHETRNPVESVKLLFYWNRLLGNWDGFRDDSCIGRLIRSQSDSGWDYCVLTGDQVGD